MRLSSDATLNRKTQTWPDQHGRPWEVTIDKESFAPCVPAIPRFRAPLMPPVQYVTADPERMGQVVIAYERWEPEWAAAEKLWYERRMEISRYESRPAELAIIAGPMPESADFVRAARAGNRWVLGLPSLKTGRALPAPEWALPILERLPQIARRDEVAERAAANQYPDADDDETSFDAPTGYDAPQFADVDDDEEILDEPETVPATPSRRRSARGG